MDKPKFVIINKKLYDNKKHLTGVVYVEVNYNYKLTTYAQVSVYPNEFIKRVRNGSIFLGNGILTMDNKIKIYDYFDLKTLLNNITTKVRDYMERVYGTGTDLAGHCIEASEYIVATLKRYGVKARCVEGYCLWDDDTYGSDVPYDPHTWVELDTNHAYIDVTADQFNPGMYEGNEFKKIIISANRPKEMMVEEPVEGVDY